MTGDRPRTLRPALFVVVTLSLSALALAQTLLARWPGKGRLDHPIFDQLFGFTDNWGAALEILIVLLVWALPPLRRAGERLALAMAEHPGRTAAAACVILGAGARFAYHATPLSMDEFSQLSQAYAFAHGQLSWHLPPELLDRIIPLVLRNYFFVVNSTSGELASGYWPGYAALLTPFVLLGAPWLLNPVLSATTLLLLQRICARTLDDPAAGGWAMLFALASTAFTINGISYYSMPAHLALNLAYAWLLLDGRKSRALLAGLVGGLALNLHNAVPHLMFAAPWLIWLARDPGRWGALGAVLVGYVPVGVTVGFAWPLFLGTLQGAAAGASPPTPPAPGALLAMAYGKLVSVVALPSFAMACARLYATWKIWIWSTPGLLVLAIAGLRNARGPLLLFAASALTTYAFYWIVPADQGHGWGYRYFQTAWAALPLLGAACLTSRTAPGEELARLRLWAGGFALASLVLATALRFWQVDGIISEHLAQRIPAPARGRWIVFVVPRAGLYTWDILQNLPGDTRTLMLMSFGARSDAALVAEHFPQAQRTLQDGRGSLWSLPDGAAP